MAQSFELIVFDWDGTLMDSAAAIVAAIQAASRDLGVVPPTEERARHVIGLGLHDAMQVAVPGLDADFYPQMSQRYRHHYLARDHELALFHGVQEMLQSLQEAGFMLAVATGKSRLGLQRALEHSRLHDYFQATRCADECHSKPHPQMLLELMDEFAVVPGQTLMIGDTTHDLQMAKNAGVASLAVAYGAHSRTLLEAESPLLCADSVAEVHNWLLRNA
ncbi:MAG: HAD-IA family hydrolase [Sterolibacterium sp.]|nr:HAD-IA family hydrolase [Sterolibacterium sp.]